MARKHSVRVVSPPPAEPDPAIEVKEQPWPSDWVKGQLLNVRNTGGKYCVTLLGEELDPRHPERALHFENSYEAQHFISWWYGRDGSNPLS